MEYLNFQLRKLLSNNFLLNDASIVNLIRHNKDGVAQLIGHTYVGVH